MTHAVEPNGAADPAAGVPRQLTALLRPELDSLAEEIITEIRRTIPEYARPIDGPYGQALRVGVSMAISAFVALILGLSDLGLQQALAWLISKGLGQ